MIAVPLHDNQRVLMGRFYNQPNTPVVYPKKVRDRIWQNVKNGDYSDIARVEQDCPALAAEITRAQITGNNVQSAVFSECVYAQTLANILRLNIFKNDREGKSILTEDVLALIGSFGLFVRYVYTNEGNDEILVQAGGHKGVDSAFITVVDKRLYSIEFKEPAAKTPEPDLPKYGEDGTMRVDEAWLSINPQFDSMVKEQAERLNFFEKSGSNVHEFTSRSVRLAVTDSYSTSMKFADVICTEDENGYLVMLPSNQLELWSDLRGEIRPAGRNSYKVWTPLALRKLLNGFGATIQGDVAVVDVRHVIMSTARGGNTDIVTRYKLNSLFFVRATNALMKDDKIVFKLSDVRQLKPTISAHMFFRGLDVDEVSRYYARQLNV